MKNLKYIIMSAVGIGLQSCLAVKDYHRPEQEVATEQYYRTDKIPTDSLSSATVSWREIFTDPKLAGYIQRGLENNLDIRVAIENIDAAEAYMKEAKIAFYPVFNGGASYSFSSPSLNGAQGRGLNERTNVNQYELSGALSWEADIWGRIRSNQRAMVATYLKSVSAHMAIKTDLVAGISKTYFQLLALDEQNKILVETIRLQEESLTTMRLLKEAGNVTEVAVKQTEAQLLNIKAQLIDVENRIKLTENAFCILMGENPHSIERNTMESQKLNYDLKSGVPIQLLSNRPDVMVAEYGLINAFELTNVARANFYPTFRIDAAGGLQSLNFTDLFSANSLFASLIGSLTQPIFNGRQIRTDFEVQQARQEQALLDYKLTVLEAGREVSDALYTFEANEQKAILKQQEYQLLLSATELSEELLKYGMANYLDVLIARETALNAQLNFVNAILGKFNSTVELYRAIGGGWR